MMYSLLNILDRNRSGINTLMYVTWSVMFIFRYAHTLAFLVFASVVSFVLLVARIYCVKQCDRKAGVVTALARHGKSSLANFILTTAICILYGFTA